MLLKLICVILIIKTYIILSVSIQFNETNTNNDTVDIKYLQPKKSYGRNCAEATAKTKKSGIYEILIPSYSKDPFEAACDAETQGGGWTIILRRRDGSVDFYRNWNTYKKGFGDLDGEFFLGLNKIHALTAEYSQELLVILEDKEGIEAFEKYERFAIGDEDERYSLNTLGKASGTAGDSLRRHQFLQFSTFDHPNDRSPANCAVNRFGAWWYDDCSDSNLAGKYNNNTFGKGVVWDRFRGDEYSLKTAIMMIRPRN